MSVKTILIVDDEEQVRKIVAAIVKQRFPNAEIVMAADGGDALEKFFHQTPELVISDIQMPKTSGIEFFLFVRDQVDVPPFIFMSGGCSPEEKAIAEEASVFIKKPFTPQKMIAVLDDIIMKNGW